MTPLSSRLIFLIAWSAPFILDLKSQAALKICLKNLILNLRPQTEVMYFGRQVSTYDLVWQLQHSYFMVALCQILLIEMLHDMMYRV